MTKVRCAPSCLIKGPVQFALGISYTSVRSNLQVYILNTYSSTNNKKGPVHTW